MTRALILGTAGHIDHGKTALVKALTGIDCDRLPEEKARGITIDIGFANLDIDEFRIGIVDLPGHERFIMNMLAGATGIDLALLVVAADDSVMPQTREHFEILQLLGLKQGVIALTKSDLVDETTRAVVEMEIRELVQGSFLERAPLVQTSVLTGAGLQELRDAIAQACRQVEQRRRGDWFRMAVDRKFVVQGHGTVVTGTVTSGKLTIGQEVEWLPRRERVRVRALQNHDQNVEEVHQGMRAALNLAGVPQEQVERGQELASPGILEPSRVVTVRLHCLKDSRKPIKHRLPARFHAGTAEIMGTVALLDSDTLKPGSAGLAQIFLDEPVSTAWGQPFILRESSAGFTLGGGKILQPAARKIRRRHFETLERVERLGSDDVLERVSTVVWMSGVSGVTAEDLIRDAGVQAAEAPKIAKELADGGVIERIGLRSGEPVYAHADVTADLQNRVCKILADWHNNAPLVTTHLRRRMVAELEYVGNNDLIEHAIDRLLSAKKVTGDQQRIALADFKPKLSNNLRKLREKIIETYLLARFTPPEVASFAGAAAGNARNLQDLFDVCVDEGFLCKISHDIYLHAEPANDMIRLVGSALEGNKGLTVAEIRDLLGTTRKFAVPFCEYLDRQGLTQRRGDLRFASGQDASPPSGE